MAMPMMPGREPTFVLSREAVEELNCPICMESKALVMLPCQHRICADCVEEMAVVAQRRRVSCPACRNEAVIPPAGFPICRLTAYFREQLIQSDAENQKRIMCHQCQKEVEARCKDCQHFLCYRCVVKTQCLKTGGGVHVGLDITDLSRNADMILQSWRKQAGAQLVDLETQQKRMGQRLTDKQSVIKVLDNMLRSDASRADKVVFTEEMSSKGNKKLDKVETTNADGEPSTSAEHYEGDADDTHIAEPQLNLVLTDVFLQDHCTATGGTSSGLVIAGTMDGHLHLFKGSSAVSQITMKTLSGTVWSICEYNKLIYAQCGENSIEVYGLNLKLIRIWNVNFSAGKISISQNIVYIADPKAKCIVKFNLEGESQGAIAHPSFLLLYTFKPYKDNSLVVSDLKRNAVFMFIDEICVWQIFIDHCSGIVVDNETGNIWVKILHKQMLEVISPRGERLYTMKIKGSMPSLAYDMAIEKGRLYLATDSGLLVSSGKSSVCVLL